MLQSRSSLFARIASSITIGVVVLLFSIVIVDAAPSGLRVGFSSLDLANPNEICSTGKSAILDPFTQLPIPCTPTDYLTTGKKQLLDSTILPKVSEKIEQVLQLENPRATTNPILIPSKTKCERLQIPTAHQEQYGGAGATDVDVMIYITSLPGNFSTKIGESSFPLVVGMTCLVDNETHRPIAGHVNIPPALIQWKENTGIENDQVVKRVMAGVFHVLGFSLEMFQNRSLLAIPTLYSPTTTTATQMPNNNNNEMVGYDVHFMGNETRKILRDFFKCNSLSDVLMKSSIPPPSENNNNMMMNKQIFKGNNHPSIGWSSRFSESEFLSFGSCCGNVLSKISLAVMKDLGFYYFPSSSGSDSSDYYSQVSDKYIFGENATCSFVSDSCDTTSGGKGDWFCSTPDSTPLSTCSYDFVARGSCVTKNADSGSSSVCNSVNLTTSVTASLYYPSPSNEMFSTVNSEQFCTVDKMSSSMETTIRGDMFGINSRCFKATTTLKGKTDSNPRSTRCFQSFCNYSSSPPIVMFKVGSEGGMVNNNNNTSGWIACPSDGATVSNIPNFDGDVMCPPKASIFCESYNSWRALASVQGPGVTTATTTTAAPPQTTSDTQQQSFTTVTAEKLTTTTTTLDPNSNPALPSNIMTVAITFYVAFPNCDPSNAVTFMDNIINANSTLVSNLLAQDVGKLVNQPSRAVFVTEIRSVSPAGFSVRVSMKRLSGIMELFGAHTSRITVVLWPSFTISLIGDYFASQSCRNSGLFQGSAIDLTPIEVDKSGCFINDSCPLTVGLLVSIVLVLIVMGVLIYWRFCYEPEMAAVVAATKGEEAGNVFDDSLSVVAHAADEGMGSGNFDPYMGRKATSYAEYFKQRRGAREKEMDHLDSNPLAHGKNSSRKHNNPHSNKTGDRPSRRSSSGKSPFTNDNNLLTASDDNAMFGKKPGSSGSNSMNNSTTQENSVKLSRQNSATAPPSAEQSNAFGPMLNSQSTFSQGNYQLGNSQLSNSENENSNQKNNNNNNSLVGMGDFSAAASSSSPGKTSYNSGSDRQRRRGSLEENLIFGNNDNVKNNDNNDNSEATTGRSTITVSADLSDPNNMDDL